MLNFLLWQVYWELWGENFSSITKAWPWGSWNPSIKTKNGVAFLTGSFLITNPLSVDVFSSKRLCSTVELFSVARVVFFNIYKMYIFTFFREVLKFWNYNILSFSMFYYCQRRIQNPLNTWGRALYWKPLTLFTNRFILDILVLNKSQIIIPLSATIYTFVKILLQWFISSWIVNIL